MAPAASGGHPREHLDHRCCKVVTGIPGLRYQSEAEGSGERGWCGHYYLKKKKMLVLQNTQLLLRRRKKRTSPLILVAMGNRGTDLFKEVWPRTECIHAA
jgi:hypothetical protein